MRRFSWALMALWSFCITSVGPQGIAGCGAHGLHSCDKTGSHSFWKAPNHNILQRVPVSGRPALTQIKKYILFLHGEI